MSTKPDQLLDPCVPNTNPSAQSHRDRSPRPYHRRSSDVSNRIHDCRSSLSSSSRSQAIASSTSTARDRRASSYSPALESKRRKDTTSSGDSGTEADDEKPLLKALTAPPLRPRKGLKDSRGAGPDPLGSPLLTSSSLDEGGLISAAGPYALERRRRRRSSALVVTETEDEKARAKRQRREKAEVLRRVAETVLLGWIGYMSVVGSEADAGRGEEFLL